MAAFQIPPLVFPAHIDVAATPTNTAIINVSRCQQNDFEGDQRENSAIVALMLSVRAMKTTTNKLYVQNSGTRFTPGQGANTRARLPNNITSREYNRLVTFGDVSSGRMARCFTVILKTPKDAKDLFKHSFVGQEGVGNLFLLQEPEPITRSLGSSTSVPIIDGVLDLFPLNMPIRTSIPQVQIAKPGQGETRYFSHHGANIHMSNVRVVGPLCGGAFCDQQVELPADQNCGCFHKKNNTSGVILQVDVRIPVPESFATSGNIHIVFRSLRTSTLFVRDEQVLQAMTTLPFNQIRDQLREAVRAITTYVNNRGGWSYVGWLRTGAVQDASDASNHGENIASIDLRPHLSLLLPSHPAIMEDEEFRNLQFVVLDP